MSYTQVKKFANPRPSTSHCLILTLMVLFIVELFIDERTSSLSFLVSRARVYKVDQYINDRMEVQITFLVCSV